MPSFSEYYWAGRRGHLIGVGGVSMSPLAEVLAEAGLVITGSDMNEGANVAHLRSLGITAIRSASPVRTAKRRRPPCARTSSWPPSATRPL